ncbi:MAG: DUF1214 domain-containing protein [Gammaproteobacteria bacterium]|nr:DUF1214 domain-containing protein [Gammaproteobacteria bacterium]MYH13914.1 DUF1214 domain-containing protein [Gammaproteobacteria bacterium]
MKMLGYGVAALVAIGLALYAVVFLNPQSDEQEAVNTAWSRFAEDVAELGDAIEGAPFNRDERTAAAGYRHIARFLATFLAEFTDFRDPQYPQFARFPNSVARIGWDNPDNLYLAFPVRGDHVYRLRGNVTNFDLITINVYSGMLGHTPVSDIRTISSVASDELDIDGNGDFVLTLGPEPVEGNWLKLAPDAYIVVIRRLAGDWERTDEGLWEVLNLTTLGQGKPRPTPEAVARQLDDAVSQTRALRDLLTLAHRLTFQLAFSPNEISEPAQADPNLPMADPFQAASRGYFQLEEDEALLVEAPLADCRYTNIQLANPWMESLDYASRQSSLNHRTAHVDADNRVRYVISAKDPGVQNWLDTAGWAEGSLCARWTRCAEYPTGISARLVKLHELDRHLPADTPRVSPAHRERTIAARQAAISRRYAGGG